MKAFQTLFPPLAPHTLTLSSARRIVLVAYNPARGTVDFRHFRIERASCVGSVKALESGLMKL